LSDVLAMIKLDGGWDVLIQDDSLRLTPRPPNALTPMREQDVPTHG
jgi:hypothetical protein